MSKVDGADDAGQITIIPKSAYGASWEGFPKITTIWGDQLAVSVICPDDEDLKITMTMCPAVPQ